MADKVKVACLIPNGIMVRLFRQAEHEFGQKGMVPDGAAIRLNGPSALMTGAGNTSPEDVEPGITEVDPDWIDRWMKQNPENSLVTMRQVYVLDEGANEQNPTT